MEIALLLTEFIREHEKKTLKKGTDLFLTSHAYIEVLEQQEGDFVISIPSQSSDDTYIVELDIADELVTDECECIAFDGYGECKHCVAAALYLLHTECGFSILQIQQLLKITNPLQQDIFIQLEGRNQQPTAPAKVIVLSNNNSGEWQSFIESSSINQYTLQRYSGNYYTTQADVNKVKQTNFDEPARHWQFLFQASKNESYNPEIKFDSSQIYSYKCTCANNTRYRMCKHVRTAFDKLTSEKGSGYFLSFKDWSKQKNELLKPYGISLKDEESKLFEFSFDYYNSIHLKAPLGFYKADDVEGLKKLSASLRIKNSHNGYLLRPLPLPNTVIDFEIGYVLNLKVNGWV
jgi:hypothetical protein